MGNVHEGVLHKVAQTLADTHRLIEEGPLLEALAPRHAPDARPGQLVVRCVAELA